MSLRRAINAKCRECIHDPASPGRWRQQVAACTSYSYPLYEVRPVPRPRCRKVADLVSFQGLAEDVGA